MSCIHKDSCRVCRSKDLALFLSLGDQPPANNLFPESAIKDEQRYPLDVYFCRNCSLVQLLDVVDAYELFHSDYTYFSSASVPLVQHFERYAQAVKERYLSSSEDLVVDIGSNDGVLLQFFKDKHRVLGIEPAESVAKVAREKGIETVSEFLTADLVETLTARYGKAKLVTANNVFAHIDDIHEIVRAVKQLLAADGVYVFEVHYLVDLIEKVEFDTVYHEHMCYYSINALQHLFEQFDMEIIDVERVPMHGGSIRVFVGHKGAYAVQSVVTELVQLEKTKGLHEETAYLDFQKKVIAIKDALVTLVRDANAHGKLVVGYGAPAKGNTLLNFCGFTPANLKYIIDTTPKKVGLLAPGTHIPVLSPERLQQDLPDYVLLLAWNYRDYILEKEQELRTQGVKFIVPIPHVEVV